MWNRARAHTMHTTSIGASSAAHRECARRCTQYKKHVRTQTYRTGAACIQIDSLANVKCVSALYDARNYYNFFSVAVISFGPAWRVVYFFFCCARLVSEKSTLSCRWSLPEPE